MKIQSLNALIYNPIWISYLLHYFLSGATSAKNKKVKLELIYLVLPFVYDEKLMKKLSSSSTRATFQTLFKDAELKNSLIRMDQKISSFQHTTNQSFVIIGSKVSVSSGAYLHTSEILDYKKSEGGLREYYKAAYNLGAIFGKEDYREIFLKVGASV